MHTFTGQTIRGYDIQQQIGAGAAGTVYKAYQPTVARYVAIKIIRTDTSGLFEQKFNDEARLIARLEHPNIVPLYDYWSDDQAAYLVMRLFNAGTLRDLIDQLGTLSLSQTIRIVDQVADALTVAHEAGVIHRDIKPENIMIDDRGNAYLTDFGIAKQIDRVVADPAERLLVGTLTYASPEQIGPGTLGAQSDVYSLGLVVFEMLTGRYAYSQIESVNVMGLLKAHANTPLPSVLSVRPDLPPEIDQVLRHASAKSSSDRYESALDFATKLHELGEPSPSSLPKVHTGSPLPRPVFQPRRRNRDFMLNNVRRFWIEGVLNNSLYSSVLIALNLTESTGQQVEPDEPPWDMVVRSDSRLPDGLTVLDCFDQLNGKLLILGQPGSGKTTTLLELARDLLTRAETDELQPIPVVVNLSSWSANQRSLEAWLVSELNSKYQAPKSIVRSWLNDDQLLLLLDGLDEVAANQREACVAALNTYRAVHSFADLVICSRLADYEALSVKLKLNGAIVVKPLTDSQIEHYMEHIGLGGAELRRILTTDAALRELTRTPFMLSVVAFTYGNRITQTYAALRNAEHYSIDALRRAIFSTYVERVFERHPPEPVQHLANGQPMARYSSDQTVGYLTWLAANMQTHTQSVFQIEGLQSSWLNRTQQADYYSAVRFTFVVGFMLLVGGWRTVDGLFDHVSLWWYGGLSLIGGVVWGAMLGGQGFKRLALAIIPGILLGVAWGGGVAGRDGINAGLAAGFVSIFVNITTFTIASALLRRTGNDRDHIISAQKMQFSWRRVNRYVVAATLFVALLYYFPKHLTAIDLLATALSSLVITVVAIIASGLGSDKIETNAIPNEGMFRSLRNGLRVGGIVMLATFVAAAAPVITDWSQLGFKVLDGLTSVITVGAAALLIFGIFPLIHHLCLRRTLYQARAIPHNLAAFLDYATQLTLLRKVGNGYIFIHRYLLEYFAELRSPPVEPAPTVTTRLPQTGDTRKLVLE